MSQGKEDVSPPRTQTDDDSEHAVEGCATSTDANEDEGIVLNTDADFSMRSFRASTSDNAEAAEPEEDEQETPAADDSGSDESAVPPSKHSFLASVTYSPESISPHLTQVQEEKSEQQEEHPEECISEHADLSVSLASEAERLMQLNQANSSASTPLLHPSTTLRQLFAAAAASAPPTGNSTAPAKRRRMPGRNSFTSSKLEEIRERFHPRGANQPAIPPSQDVIFDSETHTVPEIAAVVEWLTAVNNGVGVTAKTPEDVFGSVGSEITGSDSFVEMVGKMLAVSAGQQHGAENVGAGNSAEANFWLNAMTLLNNSGGDAPNPTDVGQMYSAIVETMTKGFEEAKCQKPAEQSLPLPNYVADARLNEQQLMLNEAFAQLIRSSGDTSMLPGIAQPTRMNTKLQPEPLNGGLDMILSAMTSGSSVDELAALMSAFAGTAGGDAAKEENSVNNLHSSHKFNVQKRASLNRSAAPIHSVSTCKIYGQQQVHSATHSVTNNKCGGGDTVPTSATPKFSTTTTADLCCSSTASTSSSALASPLSTASSNQTASSTSSASLVGQSIPEWLNEKALTDFLTQSVVANGAAEDQTLGLLNSVLRSSGTNNLGDFAGALNALINQVAATNETPKTVASVVTPNKSKLSASQPTSKSAATTTAVTAANNTRRSTLSSTPVSSGGGPLPVWLRPANNENTNNNTTKDQRQHQQPDALARTTVASKSNSITPPTGAPPTVASVLEERRRKRPRITSKSSASATAGGLFNNNLNGGSAATAATSLTTSTTTTSPVLKQVLAGVTGTNCTVSATVNSLMAAAAAAGSDASNEAAAAAASLVNSREFMELSELEEFANSFKKQRIKHGFTQGDVGLALGKRYGTDFSQTTISRFEALNLSYKNMCKLRPLLKEWLEEAEQMIENGATVVDILEAPSPQLIENQNDWNGGEHSDDRTSANGGGSSDGNSVGGGNGKMPLNPLTTPRLIGNSIIPPLKRRRKRTNLDNAQKASLDVYFRTNCRPDHQRMNEIAAALELDPDVVRVWFCNRRQKLRKVC